jgi:hypothetical protein
MFGHNRCQPPKWELVPWMGVAAESKPRAPLCASDPPPSAAETENTSSGCSVAMPGARHTSIASALACVVLVAWRRRKRASSRR